MKNTFKTVRTIVATLITFGSLAGGACAATILNGSFENTTSGSPDNWNTTGNLVVVNTQGQTDGSNALAFSWGNVPSNGQIWQTFNTIANTNYFINFDFGKYSVNQPNLYARLQLDIYDGADFSGTPLLSKLVEDNTDTTSGFYNQFLYEFTALSASTTLRFQDLSDAQTDGGGFDAMLDNVAVTPVPEPATAALFFGALAFASALRRREK